MRRRRPNGRERRAGTDPCLRRHGAEWLLLAALAMGLLAGCAPERPAPQHLLLVSIGSLRAELLREPALVPALDALGRDGVWIDDHVTVVPSTAAAHASLLTGRYPRGHGTARDGIPLPEDNRVLAEILSEAGFDTAAVVGDAALSSQAGFGQGFDRYRGPAPGAQPEGLAADRVSDEAIRWLRLRGGQRWLLFLEYGDLWGGPHAADPPQTPLPAEVVRSLRSDPDRGHALSQALEDAYRARLSFVDRQLGRVIDHLRQSGQLAQTLVVVTSDHGISTTLHAMELWGHGRGLFDETVRTPLLLRWPRALPAGVRLPRLVGNIDLLPTLLELLGLPEPPAIDGRSFALGLLEGEDWPRQSVFLEAAGPADSLRERDTRWRNERKLRGVRSTGWKLIYDPMRNTRRLFDLRLDPEERQDTSHLPLHFERLARFQTELDTWAKESLVEAR